MKKFKDIETTKELDDFFLNKKLDYILTPGVYFEPNFAKDSYEIAGIPVLRNILVCDDNFELFTVFNKRGYSLCSVLVKPKYCCDLCSVVNCNYKKTHYLVGDLNE